MIRWTLERREALPDRTLGWLIMAETQFCWTLEPGLTTPEHPAIPEGVYPLRLRWSEHFQMDVPHIDDVPGRTAIEIHPLNVPAETKGCVGVGERGPADDLRNSRVTFFLLLDLLRGELKRDPEGVQLTVSTRQPDPGPSWA